MSSFQEITIELDDGYPAYARYWSGSKRNAAVLYLHGIQSHCGWYIETARAINEAGFAVLQPDRRGSGRNSQARGHADSAGQLVSDGHRYIAKLGELAETERVQVIGVSWGGKLAAAMHATDPDHIAGLALVAPGIFPVIDVSATEKFRIGWSMVSNPERQYDIPLNDPELFTADPEKIQYLVEDRYQLHQATAGFFLASRRMDKIWPRIRHAPAVPISVFLAGQERIIDNGKTEQFLRELDWPDKEILHYPRSRHTLEFGPDRETFVSDLIRRLNRASSHESDNTQ